MSVTALSGEPTFKKKRRKGRARRSRDKSSLRGILRFFSRRRYVMLCVASLAFVSAVAVLVLQTPRYSAAAMLMVSPTGSSAQSPTEKANEVFLESHIALIKSQNALSGVVDELRLMNDPVWNPALRSHDLLAPLTDLLHGRTGTRETAASSDRDAVESALADAIQVDRKGESYVVTITATSPRPQQAANIANSLAARYADSQLRSKFSPFGTSGGDASAGGLMMLEVTMRETAEALADFDLRHPPVTLTPPVTAPNAPAPDDPAAPQNATTAPSTIDAALQALLIQRQNLENAVNAARMAYESAATSAARNIKPSIKAANVIDVSSALTPARPVYPRVQHWLAASLAAAIVLGLLSALMVDLLDDGLGGTASAERKTGREVMASTPILRDKDLRLLAPQDRHPAGYLIEKPTSLYAEALRTLRTVALYSAGNESTKVLCVTSALASEGKTTIALSLARVVALGGKKVLLIDGDARNSGVSDILNIPPVPALNVVGGSDRWRNALLHDPETPLEILPSGDALFSSTDVWEHETSNQLLQQLRPAYDLIVIDAPAALGSAQAKLMSRLSDQTILVVRWLKTPARAVRSVIRALEREGASVSGIVLNAVDPNARGRFSYEDAVYQSKLAKRFM